MRKCKSCFRFHEDWRDAEAKGLGSQSFIGFSEYAKKPRPGIKCNCSSALIHHEPKATDKGCKNHRYRLSWNLEQWWNWKFKYKLERFICNYIRRPIGRLRKPVPLQWKDSFDGCRDIIISNSEPVCPHCGGEVHRLLSNSGVIFKGTGFYTTDYTKAKSLARKVNKERQTDNEAILDGDVKGFNQQVDKTNAELKEL